MTRLPRSSEASDAPAAIPPLARLQRLALLGGLLALGACALGGALSGWEQFFQSYLVSYLVWFGIALGSLAILMLHTLTGGRWGFVIRRLLESAARTLPLMALLFVPLLFGLHQLYPWTHEPLGEHTLEHRRGYMNVGGFLLRAAIYFALWSTAALLLTRWSARQDRQDQPSLRQRMQRLSGPGLVLYALTLTLAAVDWVMSLEAAWYSTIFGMMFMVGQAVGTMAFMIVAAAVLARYSPLRDVIRREHFHDLGNLLLAFVMLWAYIAFSQYLIIWSANLKEEATWYAHRSQHGWQWVAVALIVFHFFVPFMLLLSRYTKRSVRMIGTVAALVLGMRFVDLFFVVVPSIGGPHPREALLRLHWMDVLAPVGVGGLWLAAFLWLVARRPLLPSYDPQFAPGAGETSHE